MMKKKHPPTKKEIACIFLNGESPSLKLIRKILAQKPLIVCADGASNYLKNYKIIPDIILGDLDSIQKETLHFYQKKVPILKISDQETTDFEKALRYCKKEKLKKILVLGVFNKRSDHALNNYSVLKRYYRHLDIKLLDEIFEISFIPKKIRFDYRKGETISFLALPKATQITTTGLAYKLDKEDLEFGIREGTLNKATSNRVTITFKSGDLLLFRRHFYD